MRIRYASNTHVGMKRDHNEDSLYLLPEENVYIVADGMGGHASGEVASQMAVETVAQFFKETSEDEDMTWPFRVQKDRSYVENRLVTAVKLANFRIYETAQRGAGSHGMGTTVVATLFADKKVYVGHVGDSRCYRLREGAYTQITEDHSLLNNYIKTNNPTPEEIAQFPYKNVILRALGMKETVQVDITCEETRPGDIYLLCSDGLNGMMADAEMRDILVSCGDDLEQACDRLIQQANQAGGLDNVTVVLMQLLEG